MEKLTNFDAPGAKMVCFLPHFEGFEGFGEGFPRQTASNPVPGGTVLSHFEARGARIFEHFGQNPSKIQYFDIPRWKN